MTGFIERNALWSDDQCRAAVEVARQAEALGVVRLSFPDQHGALRGKTIVAGELDGAFRNGCTAPSSLLAKDTSHRTDFPVLTRGGGFEMPEMEGAADLLLVPDPLSFKVLPWALHSGCLLCDLYFGGGRPVPFGTRQLCRRVLDGINRRGFDYIAGLKVECHIFKLEDRPLAAGDAGQPGTPPEVGLLTAGYQLLSEARYDRYDEVFEILRQPIEALGLPLRSLEVEFGPSQVEFTFRPGSNLEPADTMVLFRSAVKQICRRHGYHASFMCRPRLANIFSNGWHLHQSLRAHKTGANAFMPENAAEPLSALGRHFLAGLLRHARASAAFATPTINSYRRYRPYTLAPDRAIWGRDNRGAMVRVLGGLGDPATRLENRIGEPAANPYLYIASQIALGLDGVDGALDPGPSADTPYETPAPALPRSLREALEALGASEPLRHAFGAGFIDYFTHIKEAELARFDQEASEWEHREYFDLF
ncbi:MAG TPA: glutamine synthetase family protein [Stellaceae bacterium]|nr:glutamine synthetase family protein [Stellaceae bacterium]